MSRDGKTYDLFISYSRTDGDWVRRLRDGLVQRGVYVWLDEREIQPGAPFPDELRIGITRSRAFGLVVTPASMSSASVSMEREIALGLFERGEIRYIPLLLSPGVSFPKEVQDHKHNAVLFSDHPDKFEQLVDRLVFPGITGRHVECLAVSGPGPQDGAWTTLERAAAANDIDLSRYTDIERAELHVADLIARKQRPTRVVVFVDLLEGRTGTGSAPVYSPQQYAAMVQRLRTQYQEVNPVRFVFYQRSDAWRQPALGLDPATVAEFTKFFTLDRSGPAGPAFDRAFRARWNTVLKDLMKFEHE